MTPKTGTYADHPSTYIEEHDSVAKNTQGDNTSSVTGRAGTGTGERNRNSINQERQQQANARLPSPEGSSTSMGLRGSPSTSTTTTTIISESEGPVGVATIPACLHLTQEDLETTKLDPKEVDKNLKESSDENLMEHSQKQFCSPDPLSPGSSSLLYPLIKMATEASGVSDSAAPMPAAIFPLPKQQNLPKRPSSLQLRTKPPKKESSSSSLRFKFGRSGKSNLRQVEGSKMNIGAGPSAAVDAHGGTSTNNTPVLREIHVNGSANGPTSAALPSMAPGGIASFGGSGTTQSGPASSARTDDGHLSLGTITASPDEHEPLLSREREQLDRRDAPSSAVPLRSARPNTNNNNSNTGHGQGGGESGGESDSGEDEGRGEGGSRESTASTGESSGSGLAPADSQGEALVVMRGEALLRQPRARRPERPNSLDLSFTTQDLASLGNFFHHLQAGEQVVDSDTGVKFKKNIQKLGQDLPGSLVKIRTSKEVFCFYRVCIKYG